MKTFSEKLPFDFKTKKPLEVKFSGLDLSTDAGLLLLKQGEENWKLCQGIADCLEDEREQHKVKHPLSWCAFPCALRRRGVAPLFLSSAKGTKLAIAQVSRLRETIVKMAAKVSVSVRRTLVELAAHCPFREEIVLMAQRLSSGQ